MKEEKEDYKYSAINIDKISSSINRLESYKDILLSICLFVILSLFFKKYY